MIYNIHLCVHSLVCTYTCLYIHLCVHKLTFVHTLVCAYTCLYINKQTKQEMSQTQTNITYITQTQINLCIDHVDAIDRWMSSNRLKLNADKTQLLLLLLLLYQFI